MRLKDRGVEVGGLQQALLEAGETINERELSRREFGSSTEAAVLDFQRRSVDAQGHALAVDGVAGPKTLAALKGHAPPHVADGWLYLPPSEPAARAACDAAVGDLGLRERPSGSNGGPDLRKFNTKGRPWCALAVSTWWGAAPGGCPWGVLPAVISIVAWGRGHGRILADDQPAKAGDVVCWLRAGGRGHTGIVVGTTATGDLCTVEGNSQNAVRALVRPRAGVACIIRPKGDIP
jgi:hypothetical protein